VGMPCEQTAITNWRGGKGAIPDGKMIQCPLVTHSSVKSYETLPGSIARCTSFLVEDVLPSAQWGEDCFTVRAKITRQQQGHSRRGGSRVKDGIWGYTVCLKPRGLPRSLGQQARLLLVRADRRPASASKPLGRDRARQGEH